MQIFDTRNEMVNMLLPKGSIGCEIGVLAGEFAQVLYDSVKPKYFLLIDPWDLLTIKTSSGDHNGMNITAYNNVELYSRVVNQFKDTPSVKIVKEYSQNILPTLSDASLDWIYIDGDHSYEGVRRDLFLCESKIKPGGIICGHDYELNSKKCSINWPCVSVKQAVEEFCSTRGWKVIAKGMDGMVSFALQKV
jgi:hypothetical protein